MIARTVIVTNVGRYAIDVTISEGFDATAFHAWLSEKLADMTTDQRITAELSIAISSSDDPPEIGDITLSYKRWETDEEMAFRKAAEITRQTTMEQLKEERERREYERLKLKFGDQ